ncbi:MAG: phosphate signaling complex protein PhoU [Thomasclavelia sp.]|jgi:phosphate transport system protein|nr:phosphate signaling complex protein PhoU [Thomasclavelia sp.]
MLRSNFEEQLNELHVDLDRMCSLAINAIDSCVKAFEEHDKELANDIIGGDKIINDAERSIEGKCLRLLLTQQPIASDLRDVSTALKVVTDLERIGDQSADIADIIIESDLENSFDIVQHIPPMASFCKDEVNMAIKAFHNHDLKLAQEVKDMDSKLDEYFISIKKELIQMVTDSPDNADVVLNFLMIAKYFEKIGDHAKNICKWVEFNETGKVNDKRIM